MNVILMLLAFFLVVLGGGTFSSAKNSNWLKNSLKKRSSGGRVRRDSFYDFQNQINSLTYLDPSTTGSCTGLSNCFNAIDSTLCDGFCTPDSTKLQTLTTQIQNCYVQATCSGIQLLSNPITNVNISIASGSYPGSCYLYGSAVTMKLSDQNVTTTTPDNGDTDYPFYLEETLVYTFNGLNLHCEPVKTGAQNAGCLSCCGSDLLTEVVCLVQQLVGTLGVSLNLLACDCSCGGGGSGSAKRDVAAIDKRQQTAAAAIDSTVSVTQAQHFYIIETLSYQYSRWYISENNIDTQVSLGSTIPSQYQDDIMEGIETVFDDYYTFYNLQYNFYSVMGSLMYSYFNNFCSSCD